VDYPELHEESLQNLKFLKSTMRLMHICGVHDFGFLDLTSPSFKRFRRQLSAVINFIKFREERLGLYAELQDGREELYAGLMEVEQEHKMLQEQLEATKQKADQRWEEAQMCNNDEEELESEIAQQNKVQRAIRHESSELKKKANVLKDQIDMAELGLQELESEEKKLQSQVVQPPEELQREMKDIEVTLKQEKNRCKEAEEEARVVAVKTTNVFNAKKDLVNAIELVDKLGREMKKYHEAEGQHEEVERAMVSSQNEIKRLEELNTNHKNELQDKLSQIEASKIDSKRRLDELQSFIQETDSELQSLEKEGRDAKDRIEHEELEMNIIKNRIKEDNMKTEQEIADIVEMMHLVETKFIEQADRLHSELCAH
jgi:kinetochore protein Nuf2